MEGTQPRPTRDGARAGGEGSGGRWKRKPGALSDPGGAPNTRMPVMGWELKDLSDGTHSPVSRRWPHRRLEAKPGAAFCTLLVCNADEASHKQKEQSLSRTEADSQALPVQPGARICERQLSPATQSCTVLTQPGGRAPAHAGTHAHTLQSSAVSLDSVFMEDPLHV